MPRKPDIKQIDRIVKDLRLSKGQRRLLHKAISKEGLSREGIRDIAKEIKELYPNK
jgi:hypothetical protein